MKVKKSHHNTVANRATVHKKYLGAGALVGLAVVLCTGMGKAKPQKSIVGVNNGNSSTIFSDQKKIGLTRNAALSASVSNASKDAVFLSELSTIWSDTIYTNLLAEAAEAMKQNSSISNANSNTGILHSMEVGMHSAGQCLEAARSGLQAHCVEPSPNSYNRIHNRILKSPDGKNVKFYQRAASDTSDLDLKFLSAGGTGDHVGGGAYNVWTMKKKELTAEEEEAFKDKYVTVKSVAVDDIIYNKIRPTNDYSLEEAGNTSESLPNIDRLYLLKIDVQGHEPSVFSGITKSIREHNIDLVFTEYWPKGIDFMNDSMGAGKECLKPVGMLQTLVDSGYTLYTLAGNADPRAPKDGALARLKRHNNGKELMPINSLMDHCMWFYDLERKYRDGDGMAETGGIYEFGYWTDVLAVRPGFKFPVAPVTKTGKLIAQSLNMVH